MEQTICHLLITLTTVIFLLTLGAAEVPGVDTYWNVMSVGRYRLHTELKNYSEAIKECDKEDAHLALPTSKEAEDTMLQIVRAAKVEMAFIGINDIEEEGKMVTVKGQLYSDIAYTNWSYNEPDNDLEEDCVVFTWYKMLYDWPCDEPTPFICEKSRLVPHNPY